MSTATEMLAKYLAAEQAILDGKEVRLSDGKMLRMEDLPEVRKGRQEWEAKVAAEEAAASSSSSCSRAKVGQIGGRGFSVARMDK